jgi:hypothetical protein
MLMSCRAVLRSSVCLFAILVSVQVLAQSHKASVSGHKARASKAAAGLSTPASSGLSFAAAVSYYSAGNGANAAATAQLRGTGQPFDVVVTNWCSDVNCTSGSVGVLLGNGDGTLSKTPTAYPSGGLFADSVAIADVNGDGKLDLVVANCGSNTQSNCVSTSNTGNVAVLLGNGDGTFQPAVAYSLGTSGATSVAVADVNGDGKLDLIVATGLSTAGEVGVLFGNGDGTFQTEATYGSGGLSALAVAVADVNNDGHPDVVVANQCVDSTCTTSNVGVLLNVGAGIFGTVTTLDSGGFFPDWVDIVDVNGDGKPDLVVANSSNSIANDIGGNVGVLLGNGDGTFQTATHYLSGGFGAASVAVADVDGDGKLDLVVANCSATSGSCTGGGGTVGVLLGNGDGTFQTPAVTYPSGGPTPFGVAVADLNGDGKPDIVAANCVSNICGGGNGAVGVLINTSLTATATALTSSLNPSPVGQAVTFTATVTAQPGFDKGTPTGTVSFSDGTTNIGSSPVSSGVATFPISTLTVGPHSITATYSGDSNFVTSTSPAVPQVVQGVQGFTLSASPTTVSISAPGQGGPTTITITTTGGLSPTSVGNFTCSGLPSESNCTFGAVSGNTVSLNISTTAASDLHWPQFGHHQQLFYALLLPGFLGMVSMAGHRRISRGLRLLGLLVILGLAGLWLACGGSSTTTKPPTNPGTPVGSSTVTVNATSGALKGSTTITVTVQ